MKEPGGDAAGCQRRTPGVSSSRKDISAKARFCRTITRRELTVARLTTSLRLTESSLSAERPGCLLPLAASGGC